MLTEGNVALTVITGKSSVSVEAEILLDGRLYSATGTSKCDPIDTFDISTGMQLAIGRAVRQLGRDIYRTGNETVQANDKVRAKQKAEQDRITKLKQVKSRQARNEYIKANNDKITKAVKKINKSVAKVALKG